MITVAWLAQHTIKQSNTFTILFTADMEGLSPIPTAIPPFILSLVVLPLMVSRLIPLPS